MNKKFVIGCLAVVALVVLGGGGALYYFVGRPVLNVMNAGKSLARVSDLEKKVSNRSRFAPPNDGELDEAQLQRYLSVSRSVMSHLEGRASELERRYQQLSDSDSVGLREVVNAYADILRLVADAKERQVAALNQHGFSLAEYDWVRTQVLTASGNVVNYVDLTRLADGDSGNVFEATDSSTTVVATNVTMVEPYAEELARFVPLAVFGL